MLVGNWVLLALLLFGRRLGMPWSAILILLVCGSLPMGLILLRRPDDFIGRWNGAATRGVVLYGAGAFLIIAGLGVVALIATALA